MSARPLAAGLRPPVPACSPLSSNQALVAVLCCSTAAARQGRGSGGTASRRQRGGGSQEDVELFSIESGWNVEALEDVVDLLGDEGWSVDAAPSSSSSSKAGAIGDDGWSVEAASSSSGKVSSAAPADGRQADKGEVWEGGDGDEDDAWLDEPWDVAVASGGSGGAAEGGSMPQAATFNGRVLRKAEQQLLASLPRHMLRRLESEQREADEGAPRCLAARLAGYILTCLHSRLSLCSSPCLPVSREQWFVHPVGTKPAAAALSGQQMLSVGPACLVLPRRPACEVPCRPACCASTCRARQAQARGSQEGGGAAEDPSAAAHYFGHGGRAAPALPARRSGVCWRGWGVGVALGLAAAGLLLLNGCGKLSVVSQPGRQTSALLGQGHEPAPLGPVQTRPMMEMVRNAVFNMVMSLYGCSSGLPENTRCGGGPAIPACRASLPGAAQRLAAGARALHAPSVPTLRCPAWSHLAGCAWPASGATRRRVPASARWAGGWTCLPAPALWASRRCRAAWASATLWR